jgi:hypothetical protein
MLDSVGVEIGGSHIYVLGEAEEPDGYIKIGVHYGKPSGIGRNGLASGNWRQLTVLHHHRLPEDTVRWHEFVIHKHLEPWRKKREWFDARPLLGAPGAWGDLLDRAFRREVPGGATVDLGSQEHQLLRIRMVSWRPPREIVAECSCGYAMHAARTTLPAVYGHFLKDHCRLGAK